MFFRFCFLENFVYICKNIYNVMEIWKDIEGYEGLYQVSNYGKVKSLGNDKNKKSKMRKERTTKDGYIQIKLHKNGETKGFYIHRLVAQAFISNPNGYKEVNHIDENKRNNSSTNLEWCTRLYNVRYGTRTDRMKNTKNNHALFNRVASCCRGLQN